MVRYLGPKNRIARRFGINIFSRARNPMLHKPNPPGMHGAKKKKKSDYGVQLLEQQKLRAIYGMLTKKQLNRYYEESVRRKENTATQLLRFLECRLDILVYRLHFAATIFGAQQLVSHGHVLVNGKKVDIRSFQVKVGMEISIKTKSKGIKAIVESLEKGAHQTLPSYLEFDKNRQTGRLIALPEPDQIPIPEVNISAICDFLAYTT